MKFAGLRFADKRTPIVVACQHIQYADFTAGEVNIFVTVKMKYIKFTWTMQIFLNGCRECEIWFCVWITTALKWYSGKWSHPFWEFSLALWQARERALFIAKQTSKWKIWLMVIKLEWTIFYIEIEIFGIKYLWHVTLVIFRNQWQSHYWWYRNSCEWT